MQFQKIMLNAAAACALLGTWGAALADDCAEGSIVGKTVATIQISGFVNCSVVNVTVLRGVRVANADQFTMIGSKVNGIVKVTNTVSAALVSNEIFNGDLFANSNLYSSVVRNVVSNGTIKVNDNDGSVAVVENQVTNGSLIVNRNERADVKNNTVRNGNITCIGNDRLDSFFNNALGGSVDCRKSIGN